MQTYQLYASQNKAPAGLPARNRAELSDESIHALLVQTVAELEQKKRELRIEAALERVRARAINMHSSSELSDVLSVLFEQYDILGICPVFSHHTLFDLQNNKFSFRTTGRRGQRVQAEQRIDIDAIDTWREAVENWKNGGPATVHTHVYPKEILPQVFGLFEEILSAVPAEAKYYPEDFPEGMYITQGYCKFGYIGFGHNRDITEEEKEVVRKMAAEFERLYQRFIDLQRAEAQIREAQIETSLERVRVSAMAMQNCNDIGNAMSVLFSELDKLNIPLLRCGLFIVDEKDQMVQVWRASTTKNGTIGQVTGKLSMTIHPMLEAAYDAWKRKETILSYTLSGADLVNYYKALSGNAPQFADSTTTEEQIGTSFFFGEGALFTFSKDPLDAETSAVLKKFAAVFSLTYRRYLDLKIAEAQARQTVKQASLDRLRAEIASMRTTRDLEKITPLIWNELTILGIPFIRCGVFIMNDGQQIAHTYLSTPDGKAVASFDLPYNSPGNISRIVAQWQQKELFTEYWTESAYTEFANTLVQHGVLESPQQYLNSLPGGGFYLHFVPFLQGMLYVGSTAQLDEEKISLVQSIADAFSTAYARYEDFNKLEVAKQQVETALLNLKQAQQQLIQTEKMASLGQLTAGIAHEIQNPLNFINNFSAINAELITEMQEEIQKGNFEEVKEIAFFLKNNEEKIIHHGRRADTIVKGMLQHTQAHKGQKEPTDINRLCNEYLQLGYHGIRAKDKKFTVAIKTDFDESMGNINVVPQEIGRVLLNLLNNAFYAVSNKKQKLNGAFKPIVTVATRKEAGKAVIKVSDNGAGIPLSLTEKIFQPFFTTKPTGEGTGLGLSLSYDIITRGHEGTLSVQSTEGEGAEFVVQLPC